LTFGLAFGLQEIFANFVAGIILMFERPMRIGDWITVDEFTGVVTKIRMRATTIVNWDRKEYVIPNKDFITGRLANWTLSDTLNRIVVDVGVAYGSDVKKTKAILLKICQGHPKTVDDPPTRVSFEAFGDSSLSFVIRTFITEIDSRLEVIDDLHTQIDEAFRDAGIVIAFPQRDLHICSVDEQATETIRGVRQIESNGEHSFVDAKEVVDTD
jgi:potassium efflux system protein